VILTAGLSPAWQQILVFDNLTAAEVNRARQVDWCASGKVLNVGLALHHLGAVSKTLAVAGGPPGAELRREFAGFDIDARWIETERRTRICTTLLDTTTGQTTELVENCGPLTQAELSAFQQAYAEEASSADVVVLTGSLPEGVPKTVFRDLLTATPGRAILDCRGPELLQALSQKPFLVKPNRDELSRTVQRPLANADDLLSAMHQLNDQGAQWVVVTHGADDVYVTCRDRAYRLRPVKADVVNPIACGDCLAAGIAWATQAGLPAIEAIQFGLAAAADNASQLLPGRLDHRRIGGLAKAISFAVLPEVIKGDRSHPSAL